MLTLHALYYSKENYNKIVLNSFWLLLMISLIQLVSFPWASDYSNQGTKLYLTTISRTLVEYWLFWFAGINLKQIIANKRFWKIMSYLWLGLVVMILHNSFSNDVFGIILDGTGIYLMLADSFAIFSIFLLCLTNDIRKQTIIILISIVCLFALFSRASLYCFVIMAFLFLYKENKKIFFVVLLSFFAFIYFSVSSGIVEDRMLRLLVGGTDASYTMRVEDLNRGLSSLSDNWVLGSFMGDVESNFGDSGEYIHNYLSFWRQFGIIPFLTLLTILIYQISYIFSFWFKGKIANSTLNLLFYFTIFALLEIITARSYVFPYIWLTVSGIAVFKNSVHKEISNE
tara:strand:- start:621 stop:1646 length:1026 start_codon:yes stop_codon:yes gene_type:complete